MADQLFGDCLVGRAEQHPRFTPGRDGQSCRRDIALAIRERSRECGDRGPRLELRLDPEMRREGPHEINLVAAGTVIADKIAGRPLQGQNHKTAPRLQGLHGFRRNGAGGLAAASQDRGDRDEAKNMAQGHPGKDRHSASIRQVECRCVPIRSVLLTINVPLVFRNKTGTLCLGCP